MFGQIVIGPPGSGKTTYCNGMKQFLSQLGRKVVIINLDPGNEHQQLEEFDLNITELITIQQAINENNLGPNGALMYCMEYLETNLDWLENKLKKYFEQNCYFLFDCPGQVELYTHSPVFKKIIDVFTNEWKLRLVCVNLIDSHYCSQASTYISGLLVSLSMMLRLELPHINILSKIDLVEQYGKLDFNLEFYTDVLDLNYLKFSKPGLKQNEKFEKLNEVIIELIQDYGLVGMIPLNIQDKESVWNVVKLVDKCNGYAFGGYQPTNDSILQINTTDNSFQYEKTMEIQEKYFQDS